MNIRDINRPINRPHYYKLFHGGNGTNPVDGPIPLQGIFYGVTNEGTIEWNRYTGRGEPSDNPVNGQNWDPNTGNMIRQGVGGMLHWIGCGDGVMMAVHPNGNLHWFCYEGNGIDANWHPNSGNVIGIDWQRFRHIFARPYSSGGYEERISIIIFAVEQDGNLRWYKYKGFGEEDPNFANWDTNSGKYVIGTDWHKLRHVHGSGNNIFVIDENGDLRWYYYTGKGEEDPHYRNWHRNSGAKIGRDWQDLDHVFGGWTDIERLSGALNWGHVIYAVDKNSNLFWYCYAGNGETDENGNLLGWHPRSGNLIGKAPFRRCNRSIVVHFKTLIPPSDALNNWISDQFSAMHGLFAEGGLAVYRGTTENLSNDSNLQPLLKLHVGLCLDVGPTEETIKLFENRNNVNPHELVVYIVQQIIANVDANGCASHPKERPGVSVEFVINASTGRWLVAHEVAHVLGLPEDYDSIDNLMSNPIYPALTPNQFRIMLNSEYTRPC
ncbi:tachylectin-related carbohydrate-binding protein [Gottfriedia acidiceleris]|uniref:tachylectin-related carbohydrate-binding protein n=1 Tax=Gottfriedia acidiceleris TaxID=371036 RepID=UPI002FFD58D6